MGIKITMRRIPEQAHAELKSRAAASRRSLEAYLREQLDEIARRPDAEIVIARLHLGVDATGSPLTRQQNLEYRNRDPR